MFVVWWTFVLTGPVLLYNYRVKDRGLKFTNVLQDYWTFPSRHAEGPLFFNIMIKSRRSATSFTSRCTLTFTINILYQHTVVTCKMHWKYSSGSSNYVLIPIKIILIPKVLCCRLLLIAMNNLNATDGKSVRYYINTVRYCIAIYSW